MEINFNELAQAEKATFSDTFEQPEVIENELKPLRHLNVKDLSPIMGLVSNLGIDQFQALLNPENLSALTAGVEETDEEAAQQIGMSMIFQVIDVVTAHYEKCEPYMIRLVANMYGLDPEAVYALNPGDFIEMFSEVLFDRNFADFFKRALTLFNKAASALSGNASMAAM